jgi:hypothetical protein
MIACGRCGNPRVFCDCVDILEIVLVILLVAFWIYSKAKAG